MSARPATLPTTSSPKEALNGSKYVVRAGRKGGNDGGREGGRAEAWEGPKKEYARSGKLILSRTATRVHATTC